MKFQTAATVLALGATGVSASVRSSGECETYSKGDAEVTLCFASTMEAEDGNVVKHEATIENTGKALICDLKIDIENADEAYATWPQFMTEQKGWEQNFSQDQVWNVGAVFPAEADIPTSIRVLDGFRDCSGSGTAGKMQVSRVQQQSSETQVVKNEKPKAQIVKNNGQKPAGVTQKVKVPQDLVEEEKLQSRMPKKTVQQQKNNKMSVRAAGQCEKYTADGDAEVTLCYVDSYETDSDVVKHEATIENTGKSLVCDLKIEIENADEAYATWPQFMTEQKGWENNFSADQVWNVGAAMPSSIETSIRVLDGFRACGEMHINEDMKSEEIVENKEEEVRNQAVITSTDNIGQSTISVTGGVRNAGECEKYNQGDAELTLCYIDTFDADNGAVKHEATIENTGSTFVCNLKLGIENSEQAFAVWPQFMVEEEQDGWVQNFPQDAVWNVGAAFPSQTDTRISVLSFDDCSIEASVGKGNNLRKN